MPGPPKDAPVDFANLLGPSLQKPCSRCGGAKVLPTAPHIRCEPCDGSGWVPNEAGRSLLDVLGDRPLPLLPAAAKP